MAAKVFAMRLAPHGIQVADVQPGVIETDMSAAGVPEYQRRIDDEGLTLEKRIGQPADVAATVTAIASGGLPYMVGPVLRVDGGIALTRI